MIDDPNAAPWAGRERVLVPLSQLMIRDGGLTRFEDAEVFPFAGRLRSPLPQVALADDEVAMAEMWRAADGGPLRTFSGGLAHECGWHHSLKAGAMLGWEGETAYELLVCAESEHSVVRIGTESVAFRFVHEGVGRRYTCDVELVDEGGRITLVEVKRTERDLEDPDLRLVLAYVGEVCRRSGIRFLVVLRDDIYRNRIHRRNAHLVLSRAFLEPTAAHLALLEERRGADGGVTTRGALAASLCPTRPVLGRALIDSLIVRRRVRMDLAARVDDDSPVLIV